MQGYFLVLLAAVCATLTNACLKKYQGAAGRGFIAASVFLFLSSALALPVLLAVCLFDGGNVSVEAGDLWLPFLYAVLYILTFFLTMSAVRLGSLTVYMVYISAGMIFIPLLYGVIFLKEELNLIKGICIVLSAVTCFIPLAGGKEEKAEKRGKKRYYGICILAMAANAMTIVLSKMREVYCPGFSPENYTFYSKAAVALCSGLAFPAFFARRESRTRLRECVKPRACLPIFAGTAFGIGNILFLNISAATLTVSVQSPLFSGFVLISTAAADKWIFREKISLNTLACLVLSVVTAVLFSFTV